MTTQHSPLFIASRLQIATYLLVVCPFSIAFLVFLNSTVSFVVTDLIGLEKGQGDAVGSLGFADELLALIACPAWGLVSDKIGVRYVCALGYTIIAVALVVFVQASNVYPQLLLGRLLFSFGGSAVATMVTAALPTVTEGKAYLRGSTPQGSLHVYRHSHSSEVTITPSRFEERRSQEQVVEQAASSSRLAGFVGLFAGCGALIALTVFLPLPAYFEKSGYTPAQAIRQSFYVVAAVAFVVAIVCFFGLRNLPGDAEKRVHPRWEESQATDDYFCSWKNVLIDYGKDLQQAFFLGFRYPEIFLGYVGGLVARASSVAISLFIPLSVNYYYYQDSGLCDPLGAKDTRSGGLNDIRKSCPEAYILASILTGVSQLMALLTAPAFGFLSEKSHRYNLPLLCAAVLGIIGYVSFPLLASPQYKGPDGNGIVLVIMSCIGISQIGAIVCSLSILSNGILNIKFDSGRREVSSLFEEPPGDNETSNHTNPDTEHAPLIAKPGGSPVHSNLKHLKGCIAGIYSLYGGAGILFLTKLGGLLFDLSGAGAPFYIMASFNGILLFAGIGFIGWKSRK